MALNGVGLGLRRSMLGEVLDSAHLNVDFFEVAPENWIKVGGKYAQQFRQITNKFPMVAHGLSLSIGGPEPLDAEFVSSVGKFLRENRFLGYSEHLSYCSGEGHMYDLMPIPFMPEAIKYVVERIDRVQQVLQQPLIIENVSSYAAPGQQMTELEFTLEVLEQSQCRLLLDVNNVYVNSINHGYDAQEFIRSVPSHCIEYGHIAGHYVEDASLLIDTHGSDVCQSVWELLEYAYQQHGVFPTLLERDFNIPPLHELMVEVEHIRLIQQRVLSQQAQSAANA